MNEGEILTRFVIRHYPPAKEWSRANVLSWIAWHIGNGSLGVIKDDFDEVVGIGIARPVMKPEHGIDHYNFDPEGSCLFVDLTVAKHELALRGLFMILRKRFGQRPTIAYMRRDKLRVHPFAVMHRNIHRRKGELHGIKQ